MEINDKLRLKSYLLLLLATITACAPDQRLTEESLRYQFSKNEATLNKLAEMARQDKDLIFIMPKKGGFEGGDYHWNRQKSNLSETRRNEYRTLLKSAAIDGGMSVYKGNLDFDVHAFISGVGYLNMDIQPSKDAQLARTRNECKFNKVQHKCFIHLTKNWYMSFGTS
ncbi:hypothetical protein [Methylotenera sp.]|uniref:hypothetical protein n=1 Tax=Methylotenera sp. TaxID=2051956 RepID=UPI0024892FEF|nr:hypothetical protein [Methylotenera sp.]MDI1362756.1 hypothetical protein [Methylotenera sp.]